MSINYFITVDLQVSDNEVIHKCDKYKYLDSIISQDNYQCISVTSTISQNTGKLLKRLIENEYTPLKLEQ